MGEVQELRFVCRICSKSCVSGKSLGGHMRIHLAQISASKKEAQERGQIKLERCDHDEKEDVSYHLKEDCSNQSNSGVAGDEKINHCESNVDSGDGDQINSYELRENPKKSWRISDPKHGLIKKSNSCKECGKEFASLRALSGHMRCHSNKNKQEAHCCKECGRGFNSLRAMFGHMKSHSKKVKVSNVESPESLSDFEKFCPVRRKRSRIRYNDIVSPSFSCMDTFNCSVSELEEAEAAAKCLVMLSKGVGCCLKLGSVTESSDDHSAYFGAVTSCRSEKFSGIDGYFVNDVEKRLLSQLECFSSGYGNAGTAKNVAEFGELDLKFVAGDQTKSDPEVADKLLKDENGTKVDFLCDVDDTLLEYEQSDELSVTLEKELQSIGDECGLEKKSSENEEMVEDFERRTEYKRRTYYRKRITRPNLCVNSSLLSLCGDDQLEQDNGGVGHSSWESSKIKERECPICFKVFPSGQALGGHKRAHYNGVAESKNREAMTVKQEAAGAEEMLLDLNFPIAVDAGTRSRPGLSSWFADRRREHEALLLTT